jgi:hypothetical protein
MYSVPEHMSPNSITENLFLDFDFAYINIIKILSAHKVFICPLCLSEMMPFME